MTLLGLPAGVAHIAPPRPRLAHHAPLLDPVEAVARGRDRSAGKILHDNPPLVPVQLYAADDDVVLLVRPSFHVVVLPSWHLARSWLPRCLVCVCFLRRRRLRRWSQGVITSGG
eukprot:scaffold80902_cov69-Phaeocystis_antarctica.AAC.4